MRIAIIGLILALSASTVVSAADSELIVVNPSQDDVTVRVMGYRTGHVPWTDSKSVINGRIHWDLDGITLYAIYGTTRSGDKCQVTTEEVGTWYITIGSRGRRGTTCEFSRTAPEKTE